MRAKTHEVWKSKGSVQGVEGNVFGSWRCLGTGSLRSEGKKFLGGLVVRIWSFHWETPVPSLVEKPSHMLPKYKKKKKTRKPQRTQKWSEPWNTLFDAPCFFKKWRKWRNLKHYYENCHWKQFTLINEHFQTYVAEKAMATHPSTLAWKISWTESDRLQSMGLRRVGHDWATPLSLFTFTHWKRKWPRTPVILPGESQGRGSLVGCHLWGCPESDKTEVT